MVKRKVCICRPETNKKNQDDIVDIFKPIHILNIIFGVQKYKIKDEKMYPSSICNIIIVLFANIVIYTTLCFIYVYIANAVEMNFTILIIFMSYGIYVFNYTIHGILSISESKNHIRLMLNLQKINAKMHDIRDTTVLQKSVKSIVIIIYFVSIIAILARLVLYSEMYLARATIYCSTIIFEVDMIHNIFIAKFLTLKSKNWLKILQHIQKDKYKTSFIQNRMYLPLEKILDSIVLTNKTARVPVIIYFIVFNVIFNMFQ